MSNNIIDKIQLSGVTYDIGGSGGGSPTVELTQAEYNALVTAGTVSADTYYIITDAQAGDLTQYWTSAETQSAITQAVSGKQETLVSGTNIKTINNESILGSGNITIQGGGTDTGTVQTMIDESISGKVDTNTYTAYTAATDSVLATKQTTLTAGTGISIVDNVISATGGGGGGMTEDDELLLATALTDLNDRKIDASEVKSNYQKKGDYVTTDTLNTRLSEYETALDEQNVEEVTAYALNDLNERFGGLKIVKITESEYAALTTKDENTLYIVVADPS